MDFTKKEIETILSCIITTIEWAPSNVAPDFYDTLNSIETKCRDKLGHTANSPCNAAPPNKSAYRTPNATTSLKDILSGIRINN